MENYWATKKPHCCNMIDANSDLAILMAEVAGQVKFTVDYWEENYDLGGQG